MSSILETISSMLTPGRADDRGNGRDGDPSSEDSFLTIDQVGDVGTESGREDVEISFGDVPNDLTVLLEDRPPFNDLSFDNIMDLQTQFDIMREALNAAQSDENAETQANAFLKPIENAFTTTEDIITKFSKVHFALLREVSQQRLQIDNMPKEKDADRQSIQLLKARLDKVESKQKQQSQTTQAAAPAVVVERIQKVEKIIEKNEKNGNLSEEAKDGKSYAKVIKEVHENCSIVKISNFDLGGQFSATKHELANKARDILLAKNPELDLNGCKVKSLAAKTDKKNNIPVLIICRNKEI